VVSTEPEDDVIGDIAKLTARDYAEIGVPMILIAEDLSTSAAAIEAAATAENEALASNFNKVWQALNAKNPNPTSRDVSHAIELLADRHMLSLAATSVAKAAAEE
jgi:hypothetical protein